MPSRHSDNQVRKANQISALQGSTHQLPPDYPIPPDALAAFLHELSGRAVFPGDPDYDAARAEFNPAYPGFPRIIVFCICLADVRACLKLARDFDLDPVARAGRHSLAGYSVNDGIVIDVSEMNGVFVDPDAKEAVVGAGTQFERLNANLQSYGLHVPGGGCATVCVAGYMQGGGFGFTSREFGIHSDNVLQFKMVLADGRLVTADENQNADLFWAVRGGTGNQFGVLIEVRYRLYELGHVWGVRIDWPTEQHTAEAARVLETVQNAYIRSPDLNKLGFQTILAHDNDKQDGLRVMFLGMYTGDKAGLDAALAPLLSIPGYECVKCLHDRYSIVDVALLAGIPPIPDLSVGAMSRSCYIARDLSAAEWQQIIEFAQGAPNDWLMIDMEGYGGVIREYPVTASAFIHRDVACDFFCDVFFKEDAKEDKYGRKCNEEWLASLMTFMKQFSNGHSFQNYPNRDQQDWRWAYFGPYYNTLQWVKQKYDPGNLFRYQQSISPEPDAAHEHEYAPLLFDDPNIVCDDV